MPIFPPGDHPIKKQEGLAKKEFELNQAIRKGLSLEKIEKAADKYRNAQVALLKATIHKAIEETYEKHSDIYEPGELEVDLKSWKRKNLEQIINEFKQQHKSL